MVKLDWKAEMSQTLGPDCSQADLFGARITLLGGECVPITCAGVYEFDSGLLHFVFSNCSNSEAAHRCVFNF